ncbi:hypothetical protein [Hymenobacter sp. AT01-02]|uniref:hypothetical protein n=1 Tax=Hymenobacter sp. AT01-02 TaxID=1571877 RepID=UPI0005F15BD2|nr:hypothetical protein [Hymenobacter sp. AT01-02]
MATEYREEHRKEALLGTVIFHAALAALFFFTVFKGPDPPLEALGGDGVELNYGVDEVAPVTFKARPRPMNRKTARTAAHQLPSLTLRLRNP